MMIDMTIYIGTYKYIVFDKILHTHCRVFPKAF